MRMVKRMYDGILVQSNSTISYALQRLLHSFFMILIAEVSLAFYRKIWLETLLDLGEVGRLPEIVVSMHALVTSGKKDVGVPKYNDEHLMVPRW